MNDFEGGASQGEAGAARRFGAAYSRCRRYRYLLWREWAGGRGAILWVMLNPSTADHLGNNDPTIARCERRSAAWGYRRMEVVNLFALRAPKPAALRRVNDPVGSLNDENIRLAAARADRIVCAWGNHGRLNGRAEAVRALLGGRPLSCLGTTKLGEPVHPLYVPYARKPAEYERRCLA
jgi:hypothetical protein